MKGTGAKRNVCPGSCVSTGAKFPVAPVESAPMTRSCTCTSGYSAIPLPRVLADSAHLWSWNLRFSLNFTCLWVQKNAEGTNSGALEWHSGGFQFTLTTDCRPSMVCGW